MPRRPGRSRSEPRWSLAEPPPGLFPGGEDLLRLFAVLTIAAAGCSLLSRRPNPFCDSDSQHSAYDSCEPCPENGRCVDGKLECVQGFKRYGKKCVEDELLELKGAAGKTRNRVVGAIKLAKEICGSSSKDKE